MNGPLQQQLRAARCAVFASRDGGRSWTRHDFPYEQCGDPQVAMPPTDRQLSWARALPGRLAGRPDWLIALHSADAGWTWDAAPALLGTSHDHDAVAVDMSSSNRRAWIYITTHQRFATASGRSRRLVYIVRSRDGGKTFDEPSPRTEQPRISPRCPWSSPTAPSWRRLSTPPRRRPRTATMRSSGGARGSSVRATARHALAGLIRDRRCGPPPGSSCPRSSSTDRADRSATAVPSVPPASRRAGGGHLVRGSRRHVDAAGRGRPVEHRSRRAPRAGVGRQPKRRPRRARGRAARVSGDRCLEVTFSASVDGGRSFTAPQLVSASSCGDSPSDALSMRQFPTYGDYFGFMPLPDGWFRALWAEMRHGRSAPLTTVLDAPGR